MAIEIVDCPINSMVDLSIVMGQFTRGNEERWWSRFEPPKGDDNATFFVHDNILFSGVRPCLLGYCPVFCDTGKTARNICSDLFKVFWLLVDIRIPARWSWQHGASHHRSSPRFFLRWELFRAAKSRRETPMLRLDAWPIYSSCVQQEAARKKSIGHPSRSGKWSGIMLNP